MKKTLIAMAVATSFVAPAQAATTLFGKVEQALVSKSSGERTHDSDLQLGVKGSEDLGNGLTAIYKIHLNTENGDGLGNGKDAWVGLKGGFGTILMGRTYAPTYAAISQFDNWISAVDPAGDALNFGKRTNLVAYISPNFSGFDFTVGAATGKNAAGDNKFTATTAGNIRYSNGAIKVGLGMSSSGKEDQTSFGLSYAPGTWGVGVALTRAEDTTAANPDDDKTTGTYLNAFMNFGANKVNVGFGKMYDDALKEDGRTSGIELVHSFSKRTKAYIGYGSTTLASDKDTDSTKTTTIGMQHSF